MANKKPRVPNVYRADMMDILHLSQMALDIIKDPDETRNKEICINSQIKKINNISKQYIK